MNDEDRNKCSLQKVEINGVEVYVLSQPRSYELPDALSPAEKEVLLRVLAGESNQEIATHRGSALQTVANQLYAAFKKLGINSRAELVAMLDEGRL